MAKFDARWQRRLKFRRFWRRWRWAALLVLLTASILLTQRFGIADGEWEEVTRAFPVCGAGGRASGCVIDGDTIAIGQRRIRLTGYDAPELDGACENERVKAVAAQAALSRWLSAGPFEMEAGADRPYDQYGRELRDARRNGVSVADHMAGLGLAEQDLYGFPDDWGRTEWCP